MCLQEIVKIKEKYMSAYRAASCHSESPLAQSRLGAGKNSGTVLAQSAGVSWRIFLILNFILKIDFVLL